MTQTVREKSGATPATPPPAGHGAAAGGVELRNRTARSVNTLQGWLAILLGLPFVGAGLAVAGLLAGRIDIEEGGRLDMPPYAVTAIGATFVLAGLSLVVHGVRGLVRRARSPGLRARYPGQPWMWDYRWERRAGRDESVGEIGRALWIAAFVELFLVPFHWVAFASPDRPWVFRVVTVIFDAAMAWIVAHALYLAARRVRYGRSRVAFERFPCEPGRDAVIDLRGVSALARRYPIVATLRCVEERYETRGADDDRTTVCYEISRDERTVAPGEAVVRFPIPADAPPTTLDARPPRYWELELHADVPGVDFGARFLVPVY